MKMCTIDVLDYKGDRWELMAPPLSHYINRHGLSELWMVVRSGPSDMMKYYIKIPVPCFTEWWK